jgi:hypothetical protein
VLEKDVNMVLMQYIYKEIALGAFLDIKGAFH